MDVRKKLNVVIAIAACFMLQYLGFGSLFFCMPLLLLAPSIKKTSHAVFPFLIVALGCAVYTISQWKNVNMGMAVFGIVFPVMACLGCAIWTGLRNYSNSVLRKLVICSFATGLIGLVYAFWLVSPQGAGHNQALLEVFKQILPVELFKSSEVFGEIILSVIIMLIVPFGMLFSGLQILVSEFILHKNDEEWQYNFAYMKMPNSYVWFFILAWIVTLVGNFMDSVPEIVSVIGCNLAVGISIHYFMGGVSILTSMLRRRSATITAGRVFFPVVVACLIPGLNVAVLAVLTIMGVLETWINFR